MAGSLTKSSGMLLLAFPCLVPAAAESPPGGAVDVDGAVARRRTSDIVLMMIDGWMDGWIDRSILLAPNE